MKIFYTIAVFSLVFLTACKGDRTCVCTTHEMDGNGGETLSQDIYTYHNVTDKDADAQCNSHESNGTYIYTECKLKYIQL